MLDNREETNEILQPDLTASKPSSEVVTRLIAHIRNGTTDQALTQLRIPARHFVDESRHQAELRLMRSVPVVIGRSTDLTNNGDFITRTVLGTPIIVVRQTNGTIAAYINMCKHRGGQVESEPSGSKRVFMCQYHGWTYNRDGGGLRTVPYESSFGSIDYDCSGLTLVASHERHGFIWLDFAGEAGRSVESFLGREFESILPEYEIDDAVTYRQEVFHLDINWKLIMDGANDPLHAKFLHPNGVGKLASTNISTWDSFGRHGRAAIPRRRTERNVLKDQPIEETWRFFGAGLVIYPNSMLVKAPDHVEAWTVWPDPTNPERSTTEIRLLVRPEILNDQMSERLDLSWDILRNAALNEDWPMAQSIQENARRHPDRALVYGLNEISCQHLHRVLAADLERLETGS